MLTTLAKIQDWLDQNIDELYDNFKKNEESKKISNQKDK